MRKSRHTESAIIAALKQVEAGRKVEDVAREVGGQLYLYRNAFSQLL
jgi:tRNA threonylcarbamoyladenosine modification (KEOPS) complex Cgi121 subunit